MVSGSVHNTFNIQAFCFEHIWPFFSLMDMLAAIHDAAWNVAAISSKTLFCNSQWQGISTNSLVFFFLAVSCLSDQQSREKVSMECKQKVFELTSSRPHYSDSGYCTRLTSPNRPGTCSRAPLGMATTPSRDSFFLFFSLLFKLCRWADFILLQVTQHVNIKQEHLNETIRCSTTAVQVCVHACVFVRERESCN